MDILFTGVTGRIGSKIADHLTDGHNLIGLARSIPKSGPADRYVSVDVTNPDEIYSVVGAVAPDAIVPC